MSYGVVSVDEGYDLARKNLVGYKIRMGVEQACVERLKPLDMMMFTHGKGPNSFLEYDLGFNLCLWAYHYGSILEEIEDRKLDKSEWMWLNDKSTTLSDVRKRIAQAIRTRSEHSLQQSED